MRHHLICGVFAAVSLFLPTKAAPAADAATCDVYVKEAAAKAQGIRAFGCGYDLSDARWASDPKAHARWCRTASKAAVAEEANQRRGLIKFCQMCRAYADLAVAAAADNSKLSCGLSGPRWNANADVHFAWCMAQRKTEVVASNKSESATLETTIVPETGARSQAIGTCKLQQAHMR
jgi:hypothetical protein